MNDEIKPLCEGCPFCDCSGPPDALSTKVNGDGKWSIRCDSCGADGPVADDEESAMNCWNTRADDPRLIELVQEYATLRYSLAELRAIAEGLVFLILGQREPIIRGGGFVSELDKAIAAFDEWKARNP